MAEKIRLHATVRGYVQGVSFRYYTLKQANNLGVVGWVRNLWDGDVEVVAEGTRTALEQLLTWLHRGPPAAEVHSVDIEWETPTGQFREFEVQI